MPSFVLLDQNTTVIWLPGFSHRIHYLHNIEL